MKTKPRRLKPKKTLKEIINDGWLEIHITAHKIVKSSDDKEIARMRLKIKKLLKKIKKLDEEKNYERKITETIKKQ